MFKISRLPGGHPPPKKKGLEPFPSIMYLPLNLIIGQFLLYNIKNNSVKCYAIEYKTETTYTHAVPSVERLTSS